MSLYIEEMSELLGNIQERDFTDRDEIMEILNNALIELNEESSAYQIIVIHGMGGIGKTRLMKEFKKTLMPEQTFYVSFEISKKGEIIDNLYQIRKVVNFSCPIFDYALMRYWELTNPSVLNDRFATLIHKNFFTDFLEFISSLAGNTGLMLHGIQAPNIVSVNTTIDFVNDIYRKIPQIRFNQIFRTLITASDTELFEKLPKLLGIEIKRHILSGNIEHPVFIFDAYQESQPYSESEEWLFHLIEAINCGLFIITSREPLHWNAKNILTPHLLDGYPEVDARGLLEKTIINRPDIVDLIIETTECIPIYVELALSVYENEQNIKGSSLVDKALFLDRYQLVSKFVSHMNPKWQNAVFDLATVRIFNYEIFEYLAQKRMLECDAYEFDSIIQSNLINYISTNKNSSLLKLHDVFCRDVQRGRSLSEFYLIFKTYVEFICFRRDVLIHENSGSSLVALFSNIISLATLIENRMECETVCYGRSELETEVIEQILDIFFSISSNKLRFSPPLPEKVKPHKMHNVCQLIYAKTYEKRNSNQTVTWLSEINDSSCFGKHRFSYEAILNYTKALTGEYEALETWLNDMDKNIADATSQETWYYNRVKIYSADCEMLKGRFKSAESSLLLLQNGFLSTEDFYSINRTLGHIYRFNMQLEKAESTYCSLLKKYYGNPVFAEYLTANLCETRCYFPSKTYIHKTEQYLSRTIIPYNIKNKGKVLYSLAIANTVKHHFGKAQKHIVDCLDINRSDGYQSGELFAYLAQAYLDYAKEGNICDATRNKIEEKLYDNGVYCFLRLPIAIMDNDADAIVELSTKYEWINFKHTEEKYRLFISQLRS